jgi:ribosomal protein L22
MADEKNTEKDQAKKPAAKKPAAKKTAAKKPAARSAAKDTATKKPAAEKPAATKPAAKKAPAKPKPKAEAKPKAEPKPKAKAKPKPSTRAATKTAAASVERPVVNASARFVRVAPRKARLVADQVRGLPIEDALPLLRFSTRSAAQDIRKLIESAAANAEANHDLVADDLFIKDIHVDEGPTLRRYRPRALGRATRINKRTSHIAVALTPED